MGRVRAGVDIDGAVRAARGGHRRRRYGVLAAVAAAGMLAVACGGGGGSDNGGAAVSGSAAPSAAGSPKSGGTLSFAEMSAPSGLDPIVAAGTGTNGLIEMTAVYDLLLRYNNDTGKYEPGTADSVTANDDSTVWTIKLHPGIKFSDGTDYDADAVVFGIDRQRSSPSGPVACADYNACPANSSAMAFASSYIKDVTAVDKTTVQVTMKQPFTAYPAVLASEGGLIPSPTALKKCPGTTPANQCSFNTAPVGAGPFIVSSFQPGEAIQMTRNPNYWNGQVYLDGLRFIDLKDAGSTKNFDALRTGQVQASFLQDPQTVAMAKNAKYAGIDNVQYAANALMLNAADTSATRFPQVRQAVAAAVDPNVINQRAFDGKGDATTQLFTSSFRWYPDVPGPKYDPDQAKKLVAEAKAAGWDGKIRVLVANAPVPTNLGLAVQAMLQNVGMTVALDSGKDIPALIGELVKGNFDVVQSGLATYNDETSGIGLASAFLSTSPGNWYGVKDPTLDADLNELFAAKTDAAKTAAYKKISTELNVAMPALPVVTFHQMVAYTDKVHGITKDLQGSVNLSKAWLG